VSPCTDQPKEVPGAVPLLGHLRPFAADRLAFLTRVAREHGDVAAFRIGPYRSWLLSHPDHVRHVLVANADRVRKGPILQRARVVLGDGLLTSEGERHRADRRLLQQAFHPRRVAGYAGVMVDRVSTAAAQWTAGHPVDVHASLVRATLASAGATLLGTDVDDDVDLVERSIRDLLSAYKLVFVPFGWRLQGLPVGPPRRLRRGRDALHGLVERIIADRRTTGEDRGDLLSALVVGEQAGHLTDDQLRDHAVTLLLAGHETTANALAFACHLLATDPELDAVLADEVRRVLAARLPEADDLPRLTACRALFAESLRLYPPSWALGRQLVDDLEVDGVRLPAGDSLTLAPWVVHRDPRWWGPSPDRCDLALWDDEAVRARPRGAFFPFGAGARQCIGEGFAWTEGVLALATLLQRWRFAPASEHTLQLEPLLTLRPRGGLRLVAIAR
jgi:cytochrome P450